MLAIAGLDPFDPRGFPTEDPEDTVEISLSNRIDCTTILDRQDYEWAKTWLWCHSYGSGSMNPATWTIERPDHIYARRSIPIPGITPSGRPRYGNLWLHKCVLWRALGAPPPGYEIGDHLNGDTLDNRRCNLRWASLEENAINRHGRAWLEKYGFIPRAINCARPLAELASAGHV